MKWEFLGVQSPQEGYGGKGHIYSIAMWRTPVPGGWLLLSLNTRTNNPQPVQSFYPDPNHLWTGQTPAEANYLLRGAGPDGALSSEALLRASDDPTRPANLLES
jgi:hypothetical protein